MLSIPPWPGVRCSRQAFSNRIDPGSHLKLKLASRQPHRDLALAALAFDWLEALRFSTIGAEHPPPAASQPGRRSWCTQFGLPLLQFAVRNLFSTQLPAICVIAELCDRIANNLEI